MDVPAFPEIVGHDGPVALLQEILREDRLPHALLFSGPRGVGKATTAGALTRTLFCAAPVAAPAGPSACGACPSCRKLAQGGHPDLVRIELLADKTRILVEQVRDGCAFLNLTPLEAPIKLALIDDAALMNEAAANALLKTLEEPPRRCVLILITARPGSLPATIRSRCHKVRFGPLTSVQLVALLNRREGHDPETLGRIADLAQGSVSRALELLTGETEALRDRFHIDVRYLPTQGLGGLCRSAEYWSHKERFPLAVLFIKAWFTQAIRDSLNRNDPPHGRRALLALAEATDSLMINAQAFNLNRQLLLESLFIRWARLNRQFPATPREMAP